MTPAAKVQALREEKPDCAWGVTAGHMGRHMMACLVLASLSGERVQVLLVAIRLPLTGHDLVDLGTRSWPLWARLTL